MKAAMFDGGENGTIGLVLDKIVHWVYIPAKVSLDKKAHLSVWVVGSDQARMFSGDEATSIAEQLASVSALH